MALAMMLGWAGTSHAQMQEGDLEMRFSVVDVTDQAEAKPIIHALLRTPGVHRCDFIPECVCFKLATNSMDAATLAERLQIMGYALNELESGPTGGGPTTRPDQPTE